MNQIFEQEEKCKKDVDLFADTSGNLFKNEIENNKDSKNLAEELNTFISKDNKKIEGIVKKSELDRYSKNNNSFTLTNQLNRQNILNKQGKYEFKKICVEDLFQRKDYKNNKVDKESKNFKAKKPTSLALQSNNIKPDIEFTNLSQKFHYKNLNSNTNIDNNNIIKGIFNNKPYQNLKLNVNHGDLNMKSFIHNCLENNNQQTNKKFNNLKNDLSNFNISNKAYASLPENPDFIFKNLTNEENDKKDFNKEKIKNKYDAVSPLLLEKVKKQSNYNIFSMWEEMNSEENLKKKWFIKAKSGLNYGPFSNDEIFTYLKTTFTANPQSEMLKHSIIIDTEMDIYFKPDSALEVLEKEMKNFSLPLKPKDELDKILIKIEKNDKNYTDYKCKEYEKNDINLKKNLNENRMVHDSAYINLKMKKEGQSLSGCDLGLKNSNNAVYLKKRKSSNQNNDLNHEVKVLGIFKEKQIGDLFTKEKNQANTIHSNYQNIKCGFNRISRERKINVSNNYKRLACTNNAKRNNYMFAQFQRNYAKINHYSAYGTKPKVFNKFDSKKLIKVSNNSSKYSNSFLNYHLNKNEKTQNIPAQLKQVPLEELFASSKLKLNELTSLYNNSKQHETMTPESNNFLNDLKEFLSSNQQNKNLNFQITPLTNTIDIIQDQSIQNLIDLGIKTNIEFKTCDKVITDKLEDNGDKKFSNQPNKIESLENQLKHFTGMKVDAISLRSLETKSSIINYINVNRQIKNKFDIPPNKIVSSRKTSHTTNQSSKSSSDKHSKSSSPNSNSETISGPVDNHFTNKVVAVEDLFKIPENREEILINAKNRVQNNASSLTIKKMHIQELFS